MDAVAQELILGVASNGLWSLIAKISGATLHSVKECLSKKTAADEAIQAALTTVAEKYPLGSGAEKTRLTKFIQSPEVESIVRQLYASKMLNNEEQSTESIRREFTTLFSLHLDLNRDAVSAATNALFDAIVLACNANLVVLTQSGLLEGHESLSSLRHRLILDELATIERNLALLVASSKPDVAEFLEFEAKYPGASRHAPRNDSAAATRLCAESPD